MRLYNSRGRHFSSFKGVFSILRGSNSVPLIFEMCLEWLEWTFLTTYFNYFISVPYN